MPRFESSTCEIYYEDEGAGRPIIFIHGLWLTSRFFCKQRATIAAKYRFIAPDLRSHGRSERTLGDNTVPAQTADLHELIEALDLRDVVLVGWSSGAFNAWEYLQTYGEERVSALVIIDESASDYAWPDWPHGPVDIDRIRAMASGVQANQRGLLRERFVPALFSSTLTDEELDWMVEEVAAIPPVIAAAVLFDEVTRDYRAFVPTITVPVLVCHGRNDAMIPLSAGEQLVRMHPDARLAVFEESGHAPFYDEPDAFDAQLAQFVDSILAR
jgi:pimeloyl-ACP methyl ester carboxylesterase